MKSQIFAKLYTLITGFILIVFFVNYYFTIKTYREFTILSAKDFLVKETQVLKENYPLLKENPALLHKKFSEIYSGSNIRISLLSRKGKLISGFPEDDKTMPDYFRAKEFIEARENGQGFSVIYSTPLSQEVVHLGILLPDGNVLRASRSMGNMNDFLNIYKKNIIFVAILLVSLSTGGTFLLTRSVAEPIARLAHASSLIASGNFDVVLPEIKSSELSDLAENFRLMASEIKKLFQNISRQKEELSNIIDAVNDLLIVVNIDGEISSASKKFEDFVQEDDLAGKPYRSVLKNKKIVLAIEKTLKMEKSIIEKFEIGENAYLCTSAYLPDLREAVIVLRDISELKNLETFKRDLIANASHELRTPLTAIKGFIETLKEDEKGPNKKYLDIIERHTDRLIFIVQDLLILSRLEDKNAAMNFEKVELSSVIQDITLLLDKKARQKDLKLKIELEDEVIVNGDRNLLVQLFLNLIDNAIKYTEKGSVMVRVWKEKNNALIDIKDTGIGIDPKHLPRIFERFYVVDSSRSRSQGGTGLGLSIVKHIVSNHGGNISIKSRPGEGTEMKVELRAI